MNNSRILEFIKDAASIVFGAVMAGAIIAVLVFVVLAACGSYFSKGRFAKNTEYGEVISGQLRLRNKLVRNSEGTYFLFCIPATYGEVYCCYNLGKRDDAIETLRLMSTAGDHFERIVGAEPKTKIAGHQFIVKPHKLEYTEQTWGNPTVRYSTLRKFKRKIEKRGD